MMSRELIAYGTLSHWPKRGPSFAEAVAMLSRGRTGPAYVFAVDQASRSGGAVHNLRRIVQHGYAQTSLQRRAMLKTMRTLPGFTLERLLVVFEDHSEMPVTRKAAWSRHPVTGEVKGPERNTATLLGMGAARGRWEELLDILEHPRHQRIAVEPREWRRVLGTRVNLGTEAWKAQARFWASAALGTPIQDDNEAEACVMATWGAFDGLHRWACERQQERAKKASSA